jgi:hypothetical protein
LNMLKACLMMINSVEATHNKASNHENTTNWFW